MKNFTLRIRRTSLAFATAATLVLNWGIGGVAAEDAAVPSVETLTVPQVFTDWQVTCETKQTCRLSQTVTQPATARAILQARAFNGEDPTLLLSFPLGVLLSPGWRYRIDGNDETVLPFEICDRTGCHAGVKLTPELLAAMKRGSRMQVTFFDAARTPVVPVLSLLGFSRALEALK